jgi:hypothetical protein
VIYEHGESWCNIIDRRKLLIHPSQLSGNTISSHMVTKEEEQPKEIKNLTYEIFLTYFKGFFNMP